MIGLYTESLKTLLENQHYGGTDQSVPLTEIVDLMGKFPAFEFGSDISLNMLDLFIEKYDIREIGAESEELFMHFWREKTNELIMKYVPKMKTWLDHFNDLFKFTVNLQTDDTQFFGENNKNTYYLNPVNNNIEKLKVTDVDKSERGGQNHRIVTRDVLQTVWGKTRADIMNKIFDVKDIFNDCLSEFETIFMGVL